MKASSTGRGMRSAKTSELYIPGHLFHNHQTVMHIESASVCCESHYGTSRPLMGDENMRQLKIIVEKHPDGYVAYPLGLKGVVVGQGDTYEEVLSDVKSAIRFHIETFGEEVLEVDPPVIEAFVAETGV